MRESVTPADWRLAAVSLAVVALSAFYISSNYRAAFPQASLKLTLSRDDITAQAAKFLESRGHRLEPYRNITLFDADDDARLFLEREMGLAEANRLMEKEVPVWRWRARWYKPPQREEYRVWLSPDTGRLVGFDHILPEDAPGASLDVDAARALAETFLRERVTWTPTPVEAQSEDKPKRRDHLFTYERAGFSVKEGKVRATVVVRGAQVEGYQEFLKVPEQWQRDFAALRSKNQLYSQIAQAFYVALILGAAITLIAALRRGDIIWRPAVLFSSVVAGLNVLAEWNNLPFSLNAMPTTTPIGEALVMILLQSAGAGAGVFIYVIFAAAPGLVTYRDLLPNRLNLVAAFSRRALETREFFRAGIAGIGFAGFHLAFVTAFYLIGQRYGVWSPQDVDQSDLLSTFAPWLYPLTMSLMAASSEEFWFRLLAVPLLKRWTGSTAIAIVVPAFVWGFLHANYPQQPGYIRGVEVGVIGVAAGWLLLRFGILATLAWHYTVDAILFSTYLFASESWPLRISGFVVSGLVLILVGVSGWLYRRNGGFLVNPALTNAALERGYEPLHAHEETEPEPPIPPMVPPRLLYLAAAVFGLAAVLLTVPVAGDFVRVQIGRAQAENAAGPVKPGEMRAEEFAPNIDADAFEYLRQQVGRTEANRILERRTITGVWRVRDFQPQRKNEVSRYVNGAGKLFREDLVLDENEPGANLAADEARRIAEEHVTGQGVSLAHYKLVDSSSEKHDHRTDHSFVWEDEGFRVGEARARVSVEVLGSQPSHFRRFIKLPEQWQRDHHKPRLRTLVLPAAAGGFAFLVLGVFLRHLRRTPFRVWRYLPPALVSLVLTLVSEVNESPQFYLGYSTEQPLSDFHSDFAVSLAMRALLIAGGVFLAAYMLDVYLYLLQGDRLRTPFSLPQAVALTVLAAGVQKALSATEALIPGERLSFSLWSPPPVETLSPALAVVLNAAQSTVIGSIVVSLAVAAVVVLFSAERRFAYALLLALGWALSRGSSIPLFAFHFVTMLAILLLAGLAVRSVGAGVATLAGALFLGSVLRGALTLWDQPVAAYHVDGVVTAVMGLLVLAVAAWRNRRVAAVSVALLLCGCAPRVSFDYTNNLGVVVVKDGRACLSLPTQHKVSYPVLVILPEPETKTYTAHINDGKCEAEEGMIGHPLSLRTDAPLVGFGVVLNGRPPSRDVDHDGNAERFRACTSREGLHLTVWSGEVRHWHRYHPLGYDTEPTCTPAESQP